MDNLIIIKNNIDNEYKSIINKRLRNKKFTTERRPYKTYNDAKWTWSEIFIKIDNLKLIGTIDFFKQISIKYGIVLSTLKNKYYDFKNNKIIIDNKEHRGGSNKIFNDKEELNMFTYLKNNFIDKNEMLCDEMIKLYAINII